jgi:hypothetical protein
MTTAVMRLWSQQPKLWAVRVEDTIGASIESALGAFFDSYRDSTALPPAFVIAFDEHAAAVKPPSIIAAPAGRVFTLALCRRGVMRTTDRVTALTCCR